MSKTSVRSRKPCANKDNISVLMEESHNTFLNRKEWRYKIQCHGCPTACDYSFIHPGRLSFAFVGKLAGVFSSRCGMLDEAVKQEPVGGQLNLLSSVESNESEET